MVLARKNSTFQTNLVILVAMAIMLLCSQPTWAKSGERFKKGDQLLGVFVGGGGFAGASSITLGGSYQYFVTDLTAPGLKISGTFSNNNLFEGFFILDQYFTNKGDFLPFVFTELGYYYSDLVYQASPQDRIDVAGVDLQETTRWQGFLGRVGPGFSYFIGKNVSLRVSFYYQHKMLGITEVIPNHTGPGFGFGLGIIMR